MTQERRAAWPAVSSPNSPKQRPREEISAGPDSSDVGCCGGPQAERQARICGLGRAPPWNSQLCCGR